MLDIPALTALLLKASPAPWVLAMEYNGENLSMTIEAPSLGSRNLDGDGKRIVVGAELFYAPEANSALIVALRNAAPALLARLAEADAIAKEARTLSDFLPTYNDPQVKQIADFQARIDAFLKGQG